MDTRYLEADEAYMMRMREERDDEAFEEQCAKEDQMDEIWDRMLRAHWEENRLVDKDFEDLNYYEMQQLIRDLSKEIEQREVAANPEYHMGVR